MGLQPGTEENPGAGSVCSIALLNEFLVMFGEVVIPANLEADFLTH
jgi:hypothetical protein